MQTLRTIYINHIVGTPIIANNKNIKIKSKRGTWRVIDCAFDEQYNRDLFLLGNEQLEELEPFIIVDCKGNVLLDEVCNGLDDYFELI